MVTSPVHVETRATGEIFSFLPSYLSERLPRAECGRGHRDKWDTAYALGHPRSLAVDTHMGSPGGTHCIPQRRAAVQGGPLQACRLVLAFSLSREGCAPTAPGTTPALHPTLLPWQPLLPDPRREPGREQSSLKEAKIDGRNLGTKAHAFDAQKTSSGLCSKPTNSTLDPVPTGLDRFLEG